MSRAKCGAFVYRNGPEWAELPEWNLNLNSLLVKRQIDNPSPGAVTGGN